ncbi:hypothetical protein LQ384_23335 [Rhodococcus rhodochrous]|uniref:Uncharacterized protein n=1 Tax=Rhodococcus rhodochrous TaxID=1829 RepID=A0AAW4XK77_RHORH|nr:hypothetical protein [Rhodococcus rhodochrous]MCD2114053.1 hypothetical protein [Rhodococcus rhodochrous]
MSVAEVEQARAAVFVEVVTRSVSEELQDPSHWLDMLAELKKAMPGLPALSLDTVVWEQSLSSKGRGVRGRGKPPLVKRHTVRDGFADGKPVARVAQALAKRHGVDDLTPWPVKAVVNAKLLTVPTETVTPSMLTATSMPQLVEALTRRAQNELKVLAPALLLEKQSRTYLQSDGTRIGKLLADACCSYGVIGPGPHMTLLARNWSMLYWLQAVAAAGHVFVEGEGSHELFFADGIAAQKILHDDMPCDEWDGTLPSPSGVLLAVTDPEIDKHSGVLLAWRDAGTYVDVVRIAVNSLRKRLQHPNVNNSLWSVVRLDRATRVTDSYGTTTGVDELSRLIRLLATAPPAPGTRHTQRHDGPSRPRSAVVVRYTAKPVTGEDSGPHTARNLDPLKWRVRGHYRRQWYPSLGKHKTIWISEHYSERGRDGELVERPVVTKLSQPQRFRY